jgi:hypothetical protein
MGMTVLCNRLSLDQFHDDVGGTFFGRASIEQASDVGVLEAGQYLPLILEASDNEAGILAGPNDLQGDIFAVLIVSPESAVNLTHAADADLFYRLVGAHAPVNPGIIRRGENRGCDIGQSCLTEKL